MSILFFPPKKAETNLSSVPVTAKMMTWKTNLQRQPCLYFASRHFAEDGHRLEQTNFTVKYISTVKMSWINQLLIVENWWIWEFGCSSPMSMFEQSFGGTLDLGYFTQCNSMTETEVQYVNDGVVSQAWKTNCPSLGLCFCLCVERVKKFREQPWAPLPLQTPV